MSQAAHATPRLLMIGLDAADPELVERWTDDGSLPHLAALRRRGATGRVRSSARYLAGSPWPTFYTGQHPTGHGLYHDFQWRHEAMEFGAPTPDWIDPQPFWRYLEDGIDVVAYDVPFASRPRPFRGLEVTGWATHDKLEPASAQPPDLLAAVRALRRVAGVLRGLRAEPDRGAPGATGGDAREHAALGGAGAVAA